MNIERITKVKNSKPFTVIDIIVVVILAAIIAISAVLIFSRPAASVEISENGRVRTVALGSSPVVIELEHLTVHIADGKVWVEGADCPDKICEHTGAISRAGQQIVCLPNAVVITLVGNNGLHGVLG